MFRNYFKIFIRNVQKNKLHTAINVVGMAVAFACSIFILLVAYRDFSYDNFQVNKDRLYKVYDYSPGYPDIKYSATMPYPMAPSLKAEGVGIEKATRIKPRGRGIRYGDKTLDVNIALVDNDFFSMFSFPVIEGTKTNPLADASNIVLTQKMATNLFGKEQPIGKPVEIKIGGEWKKLFVSAVTADIPDNSSIRFSVLARSEVDPNYASEKDAWDKKHHEVYVQLAANTTQQQVESRLRAFTKKYIPWARESAKNKNPITDENGDTYSVRLLPAGEWHFNQLIGVGNTVSRPLLYVLLLISIVIILVASFNFINLNVGLAFTRSKEIGIRKCLGAGKQQVWLQVWIESMLTIFVAMMIALLGVIVTIGYFNSNTAATIHVSTLYNPVIVAVLLLLLFLVSFIASGYPSFVMSRLKPVEILKGSISVKKPGIFRNGLIIIQFVVAIVLLCSTGIIYQQFNYLRTASLGYNTTSIISVPIQKEDKGKEIVALVRSRLAAQSSVVSVSGSSINLGLGKDGGISMMSSSFDYGDKSIGGNILMADYDILKTLDITPVAGRDFSHAHVSDSTNAVILTESYAAQFGMKDVVGLSFYSDSSQPKWNVVGVIKDFHLYSMNLKVQPLAIRMDKQSPLSYLLIKVSTSNPAATMDMVKAMYATVEPGAEFKGSYVSENVDRWYRNEKEMATLFSVAAMVAIVLSCMGLFGIALIITRQRVKEIGVRKVLGASAARIATMVTRQFIRPVLVAMLIAIPIAWWLMHRWLQDFIYHIQVQWWVFLLAALLSLIIAILTVSIQVIRAAVVNPVKSLRTE